MIDITKRRNIVNGLYVIIQSDDGKEYKGYVKKVLSKGDSSKGIKVIISSTVTSSLVEGIVIDVPSKNDIQKETFKFYNLFFSGKEYYSIINENNEYILYDISNNIGKKKAILLFTNISILDNCKLVNKHKFNELEKYFLIHS